MIRFFLLDKEVFGQQGQWGTDAALLTSNVYCCDTGLCRLYQSQGRSRIKTIISGVGIDASTGETIDYREWEISKLTPLKMKAHPCTAHRVVKNCIFHHPVYS
uniref:Uncharacterized protein n=1 Tax=Candidatus Kentrum sp. LFY TaxID=2126342 RepID=A0A450W9W5_9GAMM|nr:MAG: hypothetical protein BECKLFY1418C_GA0070996_100459 [Candidatus Kentron sp. LFY]